MPEWIENRMLVDSEWDEVEYGVPTNAHRKRMAQIEHEIEMSFEYRED